MACIQWVQWCLLLIPALSKVGVWRDGSVVTNSQCSSTRTGAWCSAPTWQLTTACNSIPRHLIPSYGCQSYWHIRAQTHTIVTLLKIIILKIKAILSYIANSEDSITNKHESKENSFHGPYSSKVFVLALVPECKSPKQSLSSCYPGQQSSNGLRNLWGEDCNWSL